MLLFPVEGAEEGWSAGVLAALSPVDHDVFTPGLQTKRIKEGCN
jgi:hypothetical protein